jgi:hypothetical protein
MFTPVTGIVLKLVITNCAVLDFAGTAGGPGFAVVAVPRSRALALKYTVSEATPVRSIASGVEFALDDTGNVALRGLVTAAVTAGL